MLPICIYVYVYIHKYKGMYMYICTFCLHRCQNGMNTASVPTSVFNDVWQSNRIGLHLIYCLKQQWKMTRQLIHDYETTSKEPAASWFTIVTGASHHPLLLGELCWVELHTTLNSYWCKPSSSAVRWIMLSIVIFFWALNRQAATAQFAGVSVAQFLIKNWNQYKFAFYRS